VSIRQQQHRETRETRKQNQLLAELKKENQQLRRKIARVQKQLQKAVEIRAQTEPDSETEEVRALQSPDCPVCRAENLTHVQLPFGVLICCKKCGFRKKA